MELRSDAMLYSNSGNEYSNLGRRVAKGGQWGQLPLPQFRKLRQNFSRY